MDGRIRRSTAWWLLVGLILAVVAAARPIAAQDASAIQVSGEAAYQHVAELAGRIGSRVAGSPQDAQAADYIEGQLKRFGYETARQPFQFPYFDVRRVDGEVQQPEPRRLHPEALTYSGSTPAGGLVGDLVEGGLGRPEDLQGRPVAARILLVERGVIPFRDKAQNAANAGARAVIVYNNTAGNVMGTLSQQMAIPAVTISREEGLALVEMLRRGPVRVRLVVETAHETRTTWNVIGTRRGTREPGRALVIGGHYDSVARAPGANDNASGTAVVLEVARALAGRAYPYTVKFIAFGAEEIGLRGSAHYVQTATDQTIAMVNIDVIGAGNAMVAANGAGNGPLLDLAEHVARRFGITLRRTRMGASDHLSFERRGVPAVFFTRFGGPPIHTPEDKLDHIRPALLREGALVAAHVVDEVASGRSRL